MPEQASTDQGVCDQCAQPAFNMVAGWVPVGSDGEIEVVSHHRFCREHWEAFCDGQGVGSILGSFKVTSTPVPSR